MGHNFRGETINKRDKPILLIEAGGVDTKDEIHMPAAW
jgi:hypothetical protein